VVATIILLSLSALYAWLTWARFLDPIGDQGWYMQVSARVAAGEVLYRDMLWAYGPLPVYVLGLLYRLLRVDVAVTSLLYQVVAALACLLTYRAARFLLSAPLALLGTVVVFLGGWQIGGFFSYILAYSGIVPLGAVLGLIFVVCMLHYLKSRKGLWLIAAGVATGGTFLTKPEFALACTGTGLLISVGMILFPAGFASSRDRGMRALAILAVPAVIVVGIGYGALIYQAGWHHVWAGISGYDMVAIWGWASYTLGTLRSWCYIVSGVGIYLLAAAILMIALAPAREHVRVLCALVVLGLALSVLPWGLLSFAMPELLSAMASSKARTLQEAIRVIWAPVVVLLPILIILAIIRWFKAYRRQQVTSQVEWFYAVLTVYSTLVAARYYFDRADSWLPQHVNTLFPVLIFSLAILVPQAVERWGPTELRRFRVTFFLAAILLIHTGAGFILDVWWLSLPSAELTTPRGVVRMSSAINSPSQIDAIRYIISNTKPEDSIVALEFHTGAAGFYFLSGRRNPLRQDCIIPGIGSLPADAKEIVQRLEAHPPEIIIIPRQAEILRSTEYADVSWPQKFAILWECYENLTPFWQHIHDYYRVRTIVGGTEWGYTIYEPLTRSP